MSFQAVYKGYPYDGIKSKEVFKNRPQIILNKENLVGVEVDENVYPQFFKDRDAIPDSDPDAEYKRLRLMHDFFLHRLLDYSNALSIAEDQVNDLLHTYPFIPQDFDFDEVDPLEMGGVPHRCYKHRDSNCCITKDPSQDCIWYIIGVGQASPIRVWFPHYHIAYAWFVAMGVYDPTKDVTEITEVTVSDDELPKDAGN